MSVHFFYNYREHLIKQLKEHYATIVASKKEDDLLQLQLDEAEAQIRDYFDVLKEELEEVLLAAGTEVMLETESDEFLLKFTVVQNYLKFIRKGQAIEVEIGRYQVDMGMVETYILAYIIPGEKKCRTRKVGKVHEGGSFDENSLNYFMREAFSDLVSHEDKL